MTDTERTEQTPTIVNCLLELGCGALIRDGADLESILELLRENSFNNGT